MDERIYEMTYNGILQMPEEERQLYLPQFEKMLSQVHDSIYSPNRTLIEMLMWSNLVEDENTSNYIFSGERLIYYPNIKFRTVFKPFLCPVSSQTVSRGEEGLVWDPLFWLPDKKSVYVLSKAIRAHYCYADFFPSDVTSLDDFWFRVNNAYELGLDDYYNFSCNVGSLSLKMLNRSR